MKRVNSAAYVAVTSRLRHDTCIYIGNGGLWAAHLHTVHFGNVETEPLSECGGGVITSLKRVI